MKTRCPSCDRVYTYDPDTNAYPQATGETVYQGSGKAQREITLWVCFCGDVVAVSILDTRFGETLYEPSGQEL